MAGDTHVDRMFLLQVEGSKVIQVIASVQLL
jgi:hypothetical protein